VKPDREVINLRLARIEDCLGQLAPFGELTELQFTSRYAQYHDAKRIMAAALNAVAHIARHIQRSLGGRAKDPWMDLVEYGVLDMSLGLRFKRHCHLLGTLARAHFDEDRDIVYLLLSTELPDFVEFARTITGWLDGRTEVEAASI
jgi:uncharacterized protein YutE (UPF0331/DUF86 family)